MENVTRKNLQEKAEVQEVIYDRDSDSYYIGLSVIDGEKKVGEIAITGAKIDGWESMGEDELEEYFEDKENLSRAIEEAGEEDIYDVATKEVIL